MICRALGKISFMKVVSPQAGWPMTRSGSNPSCFSSQRAIRGGAAADQVGLGAHREVEDSGGRGPVALPLQQGNAIGLPAALRDREALVASRLQRWQQEFETAGEVVVDEKNFGHLGT